MPGSDALLRQYETELEGHAAFLEQLAAGCDGRDMNAGELEVHNRTAARMTELEGLATPLRESIRITADSRARMADLRTAAGAAPSRGTLPPPPGIEYRSAGVFIADLYWGRQGDSAARERVDAYTRAAAHQTTLDNPGLLPESIIEPLINFVDAQRPLCTAVGVRDVGAGSWSYARVTQHTQVAKQAGEKLELASRKMVITKTPLGGDTYGGYLNISKQDIRRTSPGIVDVAYQDLADQYAIETEAVAGADFTAGATAGPALGDTPAEVNAAIWTAAGMAYAGVKSQGRLIIAVSPDMLGVIGPLFAPVNPTNAFGTGFTAANFGQGQQGFVSGVSTVMSNGLPAGTVLVINSAAVRLFESKYENMRVDEPSVWGMQIGYAGDFDSVIIEATGVIKMAAA